jgi:hypothetical protein
VLNHFWMRPLMGLTFNLLEIILQPLSLL